MRKNICKICNNGNLLEKFTKILVTYKGYKIYLDSYFSQCTFCYVEYTDKEQACKNKKYMIEFKKYVDNLGM